MGHDYLLLARAGEVAYDRLRRRGRRLERQIIQVHGSRLVQAFFPGSDCVYVVFPSQAASVVPNADSERTLNKHVQERKQGLNRRP
jgi:hypothetical protein